MGNEYRKTVVSGARIECEYGSNDCQLFIGCSHGFENQQHYIAHDQDCIPNVNVFSFESCTSPGYVDAVLAMMNKMTPPANLTEASAEYLQLTSAIAAIQRCPVSPSEAPPPNTFPCVLAWIKRWFDGDQKVQIDNYFDISQEIVVKVTEARHAVKKISNSAFLAGLDAKIRNSFQYSLVGLTEWGVTKQHQNSTKKYNEINSKISSIDDCIKHAKNHLNELKDLVLEVSFFDSDFIQLSAQLTTFTNKLNAAYSNLINVESTAEAIGMEINIEKDKETVNQALTKGKELLAIINGVQNKKQTNYTLTTDSFLVCKCGGIISFMDSGQERAKEKKEVMLKIVKALETILYRMRQENDGDSVDVLNFIINYIKSGALPEGFYPKAYLSVEIITYNGKQQSVENFTDVLNVTSFIPGIGIFPSLIGLAEGMESSAYLKPYKEQILGKSDETIGNLVVEGIGVKDRVNGVANYFDTLYDYAGEAAKGLKLIAKVSGYFGFLGSFFTLMDIMAPADTVKHSQDIILGFKIQVWGKVYRTIEYDYQEEEIVCKDGVEKYSGFNIPCTDKYMGNFNVNYSDIYTVENESSAGNFFGISWKDKKGGTP